MRRLGEGIRLYQRAEQTTGFANLGALRGLFSGIERRTQIDSPIVAHWLMANVGVPFAPLRTPFMEPSRHALPDRTRRSSFAMSLMQTLSASVVFLMGEDLGAEVVTHTSIPPICTALIGAPRTVLGYFTVAMATVPRERFRRSMYWAAP
jgi:hypothetical protein